MEIFNNFDGAVSKAKEVFGAACKKTEDALNVQKLKIEAAALESKRNKDFAVLGEIYYSQIKDNSDLKGQTKAVVDAINEKSEKLENLYMEISDNSGKRKCPSCGSAIENDSIYCNKCGEKVTFENE